MIDILRNKVGAEVIVTGVPSVGSVEARAQRLHEQLRGTAHGESINFIAHSMVGLLLLNPLAVSLTLILDRVASTVGILSPTYNLMTHSTTRSPSPPYVLRIEVHHLWTGAE